MTHCSQAAKDLPGFLPLESQPLRKGNYPSQDELWRYLAGGWKLWQISDPDIVSALSSKIHPTLPFFTAQFPCCYPTPSLHYSPSGPICQSHRGRDTAHQHSKRFWRSLQFLWDVLWASVSSFAELHWGAIQYLICPEMPAWMGLWSVTVHCHYSHPGNPSYFPLGFELYERAKQLVKEIIRDLCLYVYFLKCSGHLIYAFSVISQPVLRIAVKFSSRTHLSCMAIDLSI